MRRPTTTSRTRSPSCAARYRRLLGLGAEQSAKLCVQYLAPIVKNRQYNFPPLGENPIVGAAARPNEVTYSEDWMRPDYIPPPCHESACGQGILRCPPRLRQTNPADGLRGMMVPPGGGS